MLSPGGGSAWQPWAARLAVSALPSPDRHADHAMACGCSSHAACTSFTGRSARHTALLHLKPLPKPTCSTYTFTINIPCVMA